MEITMIGLDYAKSIFQIHAVDAVGATAVRKALRRAQSLSFLVKLSPCVIGMEAYGTSHPRARELTRLGNEVKLIVAGLREALRRGHMLELLCGKERIADFLARFRRKPRV